MTKEEEKAKYIVDKYLVLLCNNSSEYVLEFFIKRAKQCAILECQSIIYELELNNDGDVNFVGSLDERITFYKGVIKAIEQQ